MRGIGASPGVGMGKAAVFHPLGWRERHAVKRTAPRLDKEQEHKAGRLSRAAENTAAEFNAERETERLSYALAEAPRQLSVLIETAEPVSAEILECQLLMLADKSFTAKLFDVVSGGKSSAETAIQTVCGEYESLFSSAKNPVIRRRSVDVADLAVRLECILYDTELTAVPKPEKPSVLICAGLAPSHVVQIDRAFIKGIVMEQGGLNAHSVIMIRAMGIPCVIGVKGLLSAVKNGDMMIMDGSSGEVIASPSLEALQRVRRSNAYAGHSCSAGAGGFTPAEVFANAASVAEAEQAYANGCGGIGLLRTEFLYMTYTAPPDEDTQTAMYTKISNALHGRPLVIRTLDAGGDKQIPGLDTGGLSGLRCCLERPALFKTQLRAILRASGLGNVSVMFPVVTALEEIRRAKVLLNEAYSELRSEGMCPSGIPVGMMMETPSAVLMADEFSKEVDFFSIGTNDLTQYLFAVDRTCLSGSVSPFQPALIRAVNQICASAARNGIPVSICGRLGEEPLLIPLWIAMGIKRLSVGIPSVIKAREYLSRMDSKKARALLEQALQLQTAEDIEALLRLGL